MAVANGGGKRSRKSLQRTFENLVYGGGLHVVVCARPVHANVYAPNVYVH
jgi:hypothetical protein